MKNQHEDSGNTMCIVVRHIPTDQYGESLKKALSYEALKQFSANAANLFWDKVLPQTSLGIPTPYEASLLLAFQEATIPAEAFGEALSKDAASIVNADILAGYGRITSTPTYILAGIRFPSCDFTAMGAVATKLSTMCPYWDVGKPRSVSTTTRPIRKCGASPNTRHPRFWNPCSPIGLSR